MKSRKQKTVAEITTAFVPSTGDEEYITGKPPAGSLEPIGPGKGWANNTINGALSLSTLELLAVDINKTIERTARANLKAGLEVGKFLEEARNEFEGDKEFGQWRAEKTEIGSQSAANELMQFARHEKEIKKLMAKGANPSQAVVFLRLSPELKATLLSSDEPIPTVKNLRESKSSAGGTARGTGKKNMTIYDTEDRDPDEEAINLIHKDLLARLNHRNPYVKLGLYPFGGPPHPDVIDAIEHWYEQVNGNNEEDCTEEQLSKIFTACHEIHMEISRGDKVA